MTVDQAVEVLNRLLAEAPGDPAGAWEVFRTWAYQRVDCERDALEVSVGYADGAAWIEFCRAFEDIDPGQDREVVLRFVSDRPDGVLRARRAPARVYPGAALPVLGVRHRPGLTPRRC